MSRPLRNQRRLRTLSIAIIEIVAEISNLYNYNENTVALVKPQDWKAPFILASVKNFEG